MNKKPANISILDCKVRKKTCAKHSFKIYRTYCKNTHLYNNLFQSSYSLFCLLAYCSSLTSFYNPVIAIPESRNLLNNSLIDPILNESKTPTCWTPTLALLLYPNQILILFTGKTSRPLNCNPCLAMISRQLWFVS